MQKNWTLVKRSVKANGKKCISNTNFKTFTINTKQNFVNVNKTIVENNWLFRIIYIKFKDYFLWKTSDESQIKL